MVANDLEQLFHLQELEHRLSKLDHVRKHAPETQQVAELTEREEKFDKLRAAVEKRTLIAQKHVRKLELALATSEQSRTSIRDRLYGGSVTNSKELSQLETRLHELDTEVDHREAELLAAMETSEEQQTQLKKVEAGTGKVKNELQAAKTKLEHRISQWDLEESMLRDEIEHIRASIDSAILQLYDRKKHTTQGTPIAVVRHGVCGGCRMELPTSVQFQQGRGVATCEQCGRILYWPG